MEGFTEEKDKLVKEVRKGRKKHDGEGTSGIQVAKWEDSNNDIIVLAKNMCSIMTEMTDFIKVCTMTDLQNYMQKLGSREDQDHGRCHKLCPRDQQGRHQAGPAG